MKKALCVIAAVALAPAAHGQEGADGAEQAEGAPGQSQQPDAGAARSRPALQEAALTDERAGKFEGFYLRAGLGLVGIADSDYVADGGPAREIEFDPGYSGSAALGYDFGSVFRPQAPSTVFTINLRSEVEFSFERAEADDPGGAGAPRLEEVSSRGIALNAYVDFDTPTQWTFYAGAGLGAAEIEVEGVGFDDSDTSGFVQLMGGAMFEVTSRVSIYAGLRSRGYADFEAGDAEIEDLASGTLEVGAVFSF